LTLPEPRTHIAIMRHDDANPNSPQRSTPPSDAPSRRAYAKPVLKQFGAASALTETNSMMGQMDGFMGRRTG
jgi:hypothetical protein